jgi:alkylation response protein AidB-like acyl-CoA dehydrogenase
VQRTLYEPEHEALRLSVREFLDRHVRPRYEDFIAAKAFPRDLWIEAGKQGFLGLQVPEQYGGGGVAQDYRFTSAMAEELAAVSMALGSCLGIHADINAPYLTELTTPEQRTRWLPRYCSGCRRSGSGAP